MSAQEYKSSSKILPPKKDSNEVTGLAALWRRRMFAFRGNLLLMWLEKPIYSAALQTDNVIMALATQDKQILLL